LRKIIYEKAFAFLHKQCLFSVSVSYTMGIKIIFLNSINGIISISIDNHFFIYFNLSISSNSKTLIMERHWVVHLQNVGSKAEM